MEGLAQIIQEKSRGHYGKELASRLLGTVSSTRRNLSEETYRLKIKTLTDLLLRVKKHSEDKEADQ